MVLFIAVPLQAESPAMCRLQQIFLLCNCSANGQLSGFICRIFCQEKISPISVKMKNSETEFLRNHGKSLHAGTLASGYFCKYLCQEKFSDWCVNFEKSQTEQFSN